MRLAIKLFKIRGKTLFRDIMKGKDNPAIKIYIFIFQFIVFLNLCAISAGSEDKKVFNKIEKMIASHSFHRVSIKHNKGKTAVNI